MWLVASEFCRIGIPANKFSGQGAAEFWADLIECCMGCNDVYWRLHGILFLHIFTWVFSCTIICRANTSYTHIYWMCKHYLRYLLKQLFSSFVMVRSTLSLVFVCWYAICQKNCKRKPDSNCYFVTIYPMHIGIIKTKG